MKIDRLLGLLNILANRERVTIRELAQRFEVSKRTISRDIDTLNKAGIPIVTYSGMGGGVSVVEGYKYKDSVLSRSDVVNLFTALSGFMSINKDSELINLMAKLVPEEVETIFSKSDYLIDLSSWFKNSIVQEKLMDFHEAIKTQKQISLEYVSNKSRKVRAVQPYKLIFKQSYWYLYGFCEDSEGFRLFKINRIVSYIISDKTFQGRSIEEFKLNDNFISNNFKGEHAKNLYDVTLRYQKANEFLLTDKIDAKFFHRDKEEEIGHIVFQISDLEFVVDLVISMQDKVKVICPLQLKDKVKLKIKKMNEIYKDDI
ncbi:Predicted DNA-binding transcriptional regulator YafY, contains an HTH and WYL domains [Hathewaya proteolytica DSM 3090]|uniref:Predicted DNA-binding transcriptional regulator YafY, contains an HTH and WYL domains n=1 Tax=Hathewaya proteolytica DSM 3090 TaxID=1121331 RepID=A0A1M6MWK4_9CLOT|nr:YafY family protein [Hathewaya proteolytica]SHJ87806.1 Predicted DNA-binding transcriptional regulator YafY, contains an HTH and WYL domains [Hathewaya proteolytica DSM 3090]